MWVPPLLNSHRCRSSFGHDEFKERLLNYETIMKVLRFEFKYLKTDPHCVPSNSGSISAFLLVGPDPNISQGSDPDPHISPGSDPNPHISPGSGSATLLLSLKNMNTRHVRPNHGSLIRWLIKIICTLVIAHSKLHISPLLELLPM